MYYIPYFSLSNGEQRDTIMSNKHQCHQSTTDSFDNEAVLHSWLISIGIETSHWGKGNAKNVVDLWQELCQGDSMLQKIPPLRRVNVAQIIIRRHQFMLIETVQEFKSGRRRFRNQPPSEKMKRGEPFHEAAIRCLQEELGILGNNVVFDESSYSCLDIMTDSKSYPGLPTEYVFHRMEVAIPDLPLNNFWRNNLSFSNGDPIKRHFWSWMPWDGKTHWQPS
jgi:hypothetical protein